MEKEVDVVMAAFRGEIQSFFSNIIRKGLNANRCCPGGQLHLRAGGKAGDLHQTNRLAPDMPEKAYYPPSWASLEFHD